MSGAISGGTIAALAAMVAGAAMQYKANIDAAKRAAAETRRALQRQEELQRQAESEALERAQDFNTDDRADKQQEIEQQLTEDFVQPAEAAQTINQNAATTQGEVSKDYVTAKAASDANQMKMARNLAGLMAKQTGANRLRQNEAIALADTAAHLDRLGSFARGNAGADEIAIKNAARPDAEMQLAGSVLQSIGSVGLMSGLSNAASSGAASSGSVGGLGLGESKSLADMGGGTGLRPWASSPGLKPPIGSLPF